MITKLRSAMRSQQGFTLIELMIVVAIIGILAAVAVPNFISYRDRSRQAAVIATGGGIRAAIAGLAADDPQNLYPKDVDLTVLKNNGADIPAGYTIAYTQLNSGADYKLTITHTASGKAACVTPASVVKDACP
jgi:prepilin-type N-terminal cleavage/methylation domain-containing protein